MKKELSLINPNAASLQSSSGSFSKRVVVKRHNHAGLLFRNIVQGILNSRHIALGLFGRSVRARRGSRIAIKAIARKIACYYYRVMTKGEHFVQRGIIAYEQHIRDKKRKFLEKRQYN